MDKQARPLLRERCPGSARAEQSRLKDEFMALLGHELRNPLTVLALAVEGLQGESAESQRDPADRVIQTQVSVLRRLAEDLLDSSRIALGNMRLQLGGTVLADLLQAAASAARPALAAKAQELLVALPADGVSFIADEVRLLQVLANLLDNASKYSPHGGVIRLSGAVEGSELLLRCADAGRGVARELQSRIFEPLVRLESARRDAPRGLGLGLVLVRRIAELHGGSASMKSDGPGKGSEFEVRIPLEQLTESEQPPAISFGV